MEKKQKYIKFGKLAAENALRFAFNVLFAYLFQIIFGAENILPGVAICVGLTMIPYLDLGIRPFTMSGIILVLYTGSGIAGQFAKSSPWIAFIINFTFVIMILLFSAEPIKKRTSISFLLCFVFCQANPVSWEALPMRMASLIVGGLIVAITVVLYWKYKGIGKDGRTLQQQIQLCIRNRGYILRAAGGLAIAMLIGMAADLHRPMWISIVVMSLTQVNFADTKQRVMYRSLATIFGTVVFTGVLVPLIPKQYTLLFILFLGYVSFFTTEYKYTQIVNAICALNASLIIMQPDSAVINRIFCLGIGITVTLCMWKLQYFAKQGLRFRIRKTAEV